MPDLRGKPVVTFRSAREDPTLGHEPLVPAHVHVEEIDPVLSLLFNCLGNIPAGNNGVTRKLAKNSADGAFLSVVPFFQCLDHLVMDVRVVEMNVEGRIVLIMDF